MKLYTVFKKTVKQAVLKATLMGAVLGLGALLGGAAWKAATTASRVCEAVQAWEDKGLHATNVWRAREVLARQGWLGPLRPSPPLDPLEACGLVPGEASACWWRLLLQPRQAGRLLACLEERVVEAEADHEAFGARLCWGVILALVVPLGLMAARRLVRRSVKGVNGHQGSPSEDCFVDAPEADASEAVVEDWATPAADVDVTEETWTTATAVVEELMVKKEESSATPPDDESVTVESTTPTVLSSAVEDCMASEVVKDPENMNVLATAETVECEEVEEEGGGTVYTEVESTDDDADNKAADKTEEAAEVSSVPDDFVQNKVVSEDPEGLAGQETLSCTLAAEAAPSEGKEEKKKKRKRKRKNLGPADVLKASGDAQVKDDHKTDAKTEVKEEKAPKAEAKGKAVPKPEVKKKEAPKDEARGKAVPKPEVKKKAMPKPEVMEKAVPKPEVKKKAVPKPEVMEKAVPKPEVMEKAVPKPEVKKKAVPKPEVMEKAVPKPEVMEKAKSVVKNVTEKVTRRKKNPAPAQPKAAPPSPPLHSVRQSWQEDVVTVRLPVPPARRRHVIGPRGDTVRQLRRDYPGVHVAVPLPKDADAHVTFRGPKSQAVAASQEVAARLQEIEAQLREAARLRQQAVATAVLDVAPNRRRLVVGPGGEELLKLQQQHPGVRVSVPPAIDMESRSVTITGPPAEVRAVQAKIKNRLAAIERQRQLLRARRRRRHQGAASASGASPAKGC
ncbi:E3 ubiquitin-protein ligase RNF12-B-like isoform X20 [Eriocheir sinensis]|uniref:E3 ubiquitin-protein ligase RNF12-B-like isoform X19 n=1 Tax=Eriocheir sinensis TaxID=95602 RepID=UPI0021C84D72|nr:E3 ubiquitin-protein ligase RNF12-B-like isoform X19 [Eriocheir sinensis]XP_050701505.1 E3 ubiquitin-protein ligase RNF12-B-like isoform X20 [Eriocheir sinensis]